MRGRVGASSSAAAGGWGGSRTARRPPSGARCRPSPCPHAHPKSPLRVSPDPSRAERAGGRERGGAAVARTPPAFLAPPPTRTLRRSPPKKRTPRPPLSPPPPPPRDTRRQRRGLGSGRGRRGRRPVGGKRGGASTGHGAPHGFAVWGRPPLAPLPPSLAPSTPQPPCPRKHTDRGASPAARTRPARGRAQTRTAGRARARPASRRRRRTGRTGPWLAGRGCPSGGGGARRERGDVGGLSGTKGREGGCSSSREFRPHAPPADSPLSLLSRVTQSAPSKTHTQKRSFIRKTRAPLCPRVDGDCFFFFPFVFGGDAPLLSLSCALSRVGHDAQVRVPHEGHPVGEQDLQVGRHKPKVDKVGGHPQRPVCF